MEKQAGVCDDCLALCQEALSRWLAWNQRYDELARLMYAASEDQRLIERLSDDLDAMRFGAVEASKQWLETYKRS
jgi:hypothetical protein